MSKSSFKKKKKTKEQHIEDVLVELEKILANLQVTVQTKTKTKTKTKKTNTKTISGKQIK